LGKDLYALHSKFSNAEYCGGEGPPKNSASQRLGKMKEAVDVERRAAGAAENPQKLAEVKGKLIEFAWWLKRQGYAESTITSRIKLLTALARRGADLCDPESVKEAIARQESWSPGRKELAVEAYSSFLLMVGGTWTPPRYRRVEKMPFIPLESEVDQFIAGCSGTKRLMAFLQLLKETGVRCGEALRIKWTDIDFASNAVRVQPEKGSNPRVLKISNRLLAMLNELPRTSQYVFPVTYNAMRKSFDRQRKRLAKKLQNPRLLQISFHTFRHFKATMEYAKTKDILHVMRLLGHRNIKNTLIYTQLVDFKADEYVSKVAANADEACKLVEAGFEYVCTTPENLMIFRKRK
jgi:integrase